MKNFRLKRLFHAVSGKCLDVAIDHGMFNEYAFLEGIESMKRAVDTVVQANPDAIQLTPGQLPYLQNIAGKQKPSLVLRVDVANVYGTILPLTRFSKMIDQPILQAVRADAACVCVNLFSIPGAPEVTAQCIENIIRIKTEADHYHVPVMVEPLVFRANQAKGGYTSDGDIKKIIPLVRQAVELGADLIKSDPTDDIHEYYRVIETAGDIPVLVRGGAKAADEEIIVRTVKLVQQGVVGIVYGRNIIQHSNPGLITRVLMEILHQGISVKEGIEKMKENINVI